MDGSVKGAEDFLALSKALKAAGHTKLRKELHKAIRDGVRQHMPKTTEALQDALPSGLAARGKGVKQAAVVKTGRDPGVTVAVRYGKRGRGLGASNARMLNAQGQFRHPTYADVDKPRKDWRWVNQSVAGAQGWFDEAWADAAPLVRRCLEAVMEDVADDIVRRAKRG